MLRLGEIIIDHARSPRKYHAWLLLFLLVMIIICLILVALISEKEKIRKKIEILESEKAAAKNQISAMKEEMSILQRIREEKLYDLRVGMQAMINTFWLIEDLRGRKKINPAAYTACIELIPWLSMQYIKEAQ